jgi:hypothetical protein
MLYFNYFKLNRSARFIGTVFFIIGCQQSEQVDFSTQIKPIINSKCISCHGGVKKNAGFSFLFEKEALGTTNEGSPAIIPGDAKNSRVIQRLHETDLELRMPYEKPALSKEEIELFTRWIDQGAQWGTHWAYIPPVKTRLPEVDSKFKQDNFLLTPIDYFVAARMEDINLFPSRQAESDVLARRAAFDITGLPPDQRLFDLYTTEKISYEHYLDSLLAQTSFGEKWASWWLDLARYSDTKGYEADRGRSIWKYRDWVIKALNKDLRFDEFTIEQLAGDLLPNPSFDQLLATAFHRNTMNNDEGGTSDEEYRTAAVIDRVNTTFDVFQSTTMSCVQCHDHPYDPFRQKEYYQLLSFFNNTRDEDLTDESPNLRSYSEENNQKVQSILSWISKYGDQQTHNFYRDFFQFLEPKYQAHNSTSLNPDLAYVSGVTLSMRNKGQAVYRNVNTKGNQNMYFKYSKTTHNTDLIFRKNSPKGEVIGSIRLNDPKDPQFANPKNQYAKLKIKAIDGFFDLFIETKNPSLKTKTENGYRYDDLAASLHWFSFVPELPAKNKRGFSSVEAAINTVLNNPEHLTPIMVENKDFMKRKTQLFDRGSWLNKKEEVQPSVPTTLNQWDEEWETNRLGLAKWLVNEENPLTSRTLVNRVWYQIFGKGLVLTLEDLGTQSEPPTHPALLDWLAADFVSTKEWSLKSFIKMVLMSATYKQSSVIEENKYGADPENLYYARGNKLRLDAEEIRDQALYVSNLLSTKKYGPGVMPPQPEGIWEHAYLGNLWKESKGEDRYRRAIYTYLKRTSPYPSLISFDAGSREVCLVRRTPSNTPLQALVTLNDPVFLEAALSLASLYAHLPVHEAVKKMYRKAVYKEIDGEVLELLETLYSNAFQDFDQVPEKLQNFFNQKTSVDRKIASLAIIANTIMNLDEFLTHG